MWLNQQKPVDLVTFTKEILTGKLHFCAVFFETRNLNKLSVKGVTLFSQNLAPKTRGVQP